MNTLALENAAIEAAAKILGESVAHVNAVIYDEEFGFDEAIETMIADKTLEEATQYVLDLYSNISEDLEEA